MTREFHADPNLHKNPNVQLVGDYTTGGSQSVSFEWSWKWRPPKAQEDKGGGWRNTCSVCLLYLRSCISADLAIVCGIRSTSSSSKHASQLFILGLK